MRGTDLDTRVIDQFVLTQKEQGRESFNPQIQKPLLYLKCWGSDYPYLQIVDQQKRWLPALVDSTPGV